MTDTNVSPSGRLVYVTASEVCCNETWEEAYARFETPVEETQKFVRRLRKLGADAWPRDAEIVELFCGRGNGLHALGRFGFNRVEGVDLSAALLAQYDGPAKCYVCDCRQLLFADRSKDVLIVQGGLHHLATLPDDLIRTFEEVRRVLRPGGWFVVVEPWLTPFLAFVHAVCRSRLARKLSRKVDALAIMTDCERTTYEQWLGRSGEILDLLHQYFTAEQCRISWGKLRFVGHKA